MTAQEALEWGFVSEIKDAVKIDPQTADAIKKSGSPIAIATSDIVEPTHEDKKMDLKVMAKTLGLPENATEDQINARIADNANKAAGYDSLKADHEKREKEEKAAKIKAILDAAEKEKRIKADARANWQKQLEADFEGTKALLEGLQPVVKLSNGIKTDLEGNGGTYQGKTYEQLQDENPELLSELEDNNPDAYNALFADWKKRNKIK